MKALRILIFESRKPCKDIYFDTERDLRFYLATHPFKKGTRIYFLELIECINKYNITDFITIE